MEQPDARLVERCINGDETAWEMVVNTYAKRIYNLAYRYTGRTDVAEDLTQETFLRIYQSLRGYKPEAGSLQNWILRVARNLIIDHYRQSRRHQKVAGSDELEKLDFTESQDQDPLSSVYQQEKIKFLNSGLEALSPELKEAVILRDIEGLSHEEMAKLLNIPIGTVKSRINRGRIELAKILRKRRARMRGYSF